MSESSGASRARVDGKFFRIGSRKFHPKGVTYGPFVPTAQTGTFPSRSQVLIDFDLIQQLGANVVRVYDVPPPWFLDLASAHELRVFIDIPWSRHLCFLDRSDQARGALEAVRQATAACAGHPAVFAYSVVNEIPAEILRWYGTRRVVRFVDRLIQVARDNDPGGLCTFGSFPSTEFLVSANADFVCFNVFLHQRRAYEAYLDRLQLLAGPRPLVLGECGIDSLREGELPKAEMLSWQVEGAFRRGLAGVFVFSFTDDWHRSGRAVMDWEFGLTTRERRLKESYRAVQRQFRSAPYFRLSRLPRVSVVVACYNGERTLKGCLDALSRLGYPDYEVVLVDDGSTDATAQIAMGYPAVRYVRQEHHGLAVARNTGTAAASGDLIAFTDADCCPDGDWLYYVVQEMLVEGVAAAGGPNILPPDDSRVAAAVMASPGGPTQVMLNDRDAEHIPGCNLVFWRWALEEIGGFDPVFHQAGDDVDVCWRLLERGWRIRFSAAGFVWHYHRSTIGAYLAQQSGYGEAEALLARKHPEYFNLLGSSQWRGRIYAASRPGGAGPGREVTYRGPFGTGAFQRLYAGSSDGWAQALTSLQYHALVTLPLLAVGMAFPVLLPLGVASLGLSLAAALGLALGAEVPRAQRAFWSRPLIWVLHLLQPLVRGWARQRWRFTARSVRPMTFRRSDAGRARWLERSRQVLAFFSEHGIDRMGFLQAILEQVRRESWEWQEDAGWAEFDAEVVGRRWSRLQLTTVAEELGEGRRVLRCRLRTYWSLTAWLVAAAVTAGALITQMTLGWAQPWYSLVWLLPVLLVVRAEHERRVLLQLLVAVVNEVAERLRLHHMLPPAATAVRRPTLPTRRRDGDALEELL